jgi:hypothetical protein
MFDYASPYTAYGLTFWPGQFRIDGAAYTSASSIPSLSIAFNDTQYYPSFCIKSDGTANIRWFANSSTLQNAVQYCDFIIPSAHPLVFNSQCVMNVSVQDSESTSLLIYDINNPASEGDRFNSGIGSYTSTVVRTCLGHKSNKTYLLVSTDSGMNVKTAANLMYDLGCDYAAAMDASTPVEMRIKNGYGANGKVTSNAGTSMSQCVCAYIK